MPSARKLIVFLVLIIIAFFQAVPAQAALKDITPADWNADKQASYSLQSLQFGLICEGIRIDGCPIKTVQDDGQTKLQVYKGPPTGGALGQLAGIMGSLYNPPTSSIQYLANIGENLGVVTPAYAQAFAVPGSGSSIITPILGLWQVARNIAYLAFILIFLVVGIMIMLRQKISQQAVISIQQALPGLVIGIILVTFSYFIAALIIDLAFIGLPLVANIFAAAGNNAFGNNAVQLQEFARNASPFHLFGAAMLHDIGDTRDFVGGLYQIPGSSIGNYGLTTLLTTIMGTIIGTLIAPGLGTLIGLGVGAVGGPAIAPAIIGLLIPLIILVALFIQMFKLLFALISTYIQLLIAVLTGPLVILASSIPGRGGGVGGWIKSLLGNALVFPAVFAAFLFAGLVLATDNSSWYASPPLFGELPTGLLKMLIAYGIILGTPGIPDAVRGAFGVKPQQGGFVGAALAGFSAGVAGGQGIITAGRGGVQRAYNARALNPLILTAQNSGWVPNFIKGKLRLHP